jgi:phosphatidylinositol alpha-1,6-mannosyltransferase
MVIGVFTSLTGFGGIQQVGRHSAAVLQQMARARGLSCELLGLNDPPGSNSFTVAGETYSFYGFGRGKAALIRHLIKAAPRLEFALLGHAHLAPLGMFLRVLNRRLQYWVAAYGVEVWQPLPLLRRQGLRGADGITSISADTAERMARAQGLDPGKVFLLPPALEPGFADLSLKGAPLPIPLEGRVILSVGRLVSSEPGKGFDTVIRAMPQVLRRVPDCSYVVVGEGDDRGRLEQLAEVTGVREHVFFVGEQTTDELKKCYARCDVFAMPSRQEGFGIAFLEAMAFGKPILAGKHGGAPEVVWDGETGFLVGFDCVDELAERLVRLLCDDVTRGRMGEAGRRRVEQYFSFEHFRQRFLHLLERVV